MFPDISSAGLHIFAMIAMLSDHMWATVISGQEWMTCVGRLAFPIFAFLIVEGYNHTHDWKKYMLRMLSFALVSEIPFDLMVEGTWFYPYHQNVMWTFLLALLGMWGVDRIREKGKWWLSIPLGGLIMLVCCVLGFLLMTDYFGFGVLMVFVFYLFRGKSWWCCLGQLIGIFWINVELIGGYGYEITLFGREIFLAQQSFALLSLIPIWMYRGRQGYHNKPFQYFCYAFYPVHMLLLWLAVVLRLFG